MPHSRPVSFKIQTKHPQMRTTAECGCTTAGCGCTETPAFVSKEHCECNTSFLWSFSLPSDKDSIQQDEQGTWGFELTAIKHKGCGKFVCTSKLDPMIDSIVQGPKPMDINDIHDIHGVNMTKTPSGRRCRVHSKGYIPTVCCQDKLVPCSSWLLSVRFL